MRALRSALVVLLVSIGASALAPAQSLSNRQQEFMTAYKSMVELQDYRGINKLAGRDLRLTEEVLLQYSFKIVFGEESALEEIALLATAADEVEQGKRYTQRFARLKAAEAEGRQAWMTAWNAWAKGSTTFAEANQKREAADYRRAFVELQDAVAAAEKANDAEIASIARYHVGYCHEQLGEYEEVVKVYDKAMDEWLAAGRPKEAMYQHMVDKRRELIEKGHDPLEKGKEEGAKAKRNSTTAYKEGSEWQEFETAYKEMKEPAQLVSTSPWGVDHLLLWREFGWSPGAHPFGTLVQAAPFGKPLSLLREGSKGFFDHDGNGKESKGDSPLKIIDGKPTLNSFKSGDGKEAESYAFFLLSGGASQTWFQSPVNYQNSGRYRIGCYREGKFLEETLLFVDDNCSGSIGDPSDQGDNILRGNPRWIDNDGVVIGKNRPQPWSDVLHVAGKWWHMKPVDPHAKKVRARELDISTGHVVLKWNGPVQPKMVVLAEVKEFKGSFFDVAGGKPVELPVGRYEIAYGRIETGKAAQGKQAWIFKGDSPAFEVKEGETTTLDLGAPYTVTWKAEDQGNALVIDGKSLLVREKSGAIVGRIYDEIPYFEVASRPKDSTGSGGKPKAMSKISTETFNSDNVAAWFPANFVIEKAKSAELEVQLSLKKHALLGGPFTSEWQ